MTAIYADIPTRYSEKPWRLFLYANTDGLDTLEIIGRLRLLGCHGVTLAKARVNLEQGGMDTGLTYSDLERHKTCMVVAKASSVAEFANSYHHELQHMLQHMMQAYDISPWGEEAAYLAGDTACLLYPKIKRFLCDCKHRCKLHS